MAQQPHGKSHRRHTQLFLEKGISVLAVGMVFFLISLALLNHPVWGIAAKALLMPAGIAIGIGVLLLAIHFVLNSRSRAETAAAPPLQTPADAAPLVEQESTNTPAARMPSAAPTVPNEWSASVFSAIEWRRFEAVCEALFAQAGFETRSQSHGPDGGVDVWLHSKNAHGPVSVAQCKHWQAKPVGVKEIREFFGVMASHQLKRGTYATTSTFTLDAVTFAKSNGIHLLDGAGLLKLIAQRTPEQQQALLAVAFEGDCAEANSHPPCPAAPTTTSM